MDQENHYSGKTAFYSPSVMGALYASEDLNATFAAVAESMSQVVRSRGNESQIHTGQIGSPVTTYRIQWVWIALPAIVVLASLAQLLITMHQTKKTPLWKSHSLATLSRGAYLGDILHECSTIEELQNAAKEKNVTLFGHMKSDHEQSLAPQYLRRQSLIHGKGTNPQATVSAVTENSSLNDEMVGSHQRLMDEVSTSRYL